MLVAFAIFAKSMAQNNNGRWKQKLRRMRRRPGPKFSHTWAAAAPPDSPFAHMEEYIELEIFNPPPRVQSKVIVCSRSNLRASAPLRQTTASFSMQHMPPDDMIHIRRIHLPARNQFAAA